MAQIIYAQNALANLERVFTFLAEHVPGVARDAAAAICNAVEISGDHPLMGRRVEGEIHALVISYGKTGHIALYRFLPAQDQVRILAIRHQRELDYPID